MMLIPVLLSTVFVITVSQKDGDVRLTDGGAPYQGRVEIFHEGVWISVCSKTWTIYNSKIVCIDLGFPYHGASSIPGAFYGEGTGRYLLDIACEGHEDKLKDCHSYSGTCVRGQEVSVICAEINEVRLLGSAPSFGRVEVLYGNQSWIPVCQHNEWSDESAKVVCQKLGFFSGGVAYNEYSSNHGVSTSSDLPLTVHYLHCNKSDNSLDTCHYKVHVDACKDNLQASVICFDGNIRLVNGQRFNAGRLEIFHEDGWGTVCQSQWDQTDAQVICRQMGLPYQSASATNGAHFGEGAAENEIWLSGLECGGDEADIGDCMHGGWGGHDEDCSHGDDVGLVCSVCGDPRPLGMANGVIQNHQISASTHYSWYTPSNARLNQPGWWSAYQDDEAPWISVEFYSHVTVTQILSQGSGSHSYSAWVKAFELLAGDYFNLNYVENGDGEKGYTANTDIDTVVPIPLHVPITAKIFKLHPTDCHIYCAMRFELVGCYPVNECVTESPCDENAICSDLNDGYKCTCKPGYGGNGFQCVEFSIDSITADTPQMVTFTDNEDTQLNAGFTVAAVFGTLFALTLILIFLWCIYHRKKHHDKAQSDTLTPSHNQTEHATSFTHVYDGIDNVTYADNENIAAIHNTPLNQTVPLTENNKHEVVHKNSLHTYAYVENTTETKPTSQPSAPPVGHTETDQNSTAMSNDHANSSDHAYTYVETSSTLQSQSNPSAPDISVSENSKEMSSLIEPSPTLISESHVQEERVLGQNDQQDNAYARVETLERSHQSIHPPPPPPESPRTPQQILVNNTSTPTSPDSAGFVDNIIYTSSEEESIQMAPSGTRADYAANDEGWKRNSIYLSESSDVNNEEGWKQNSIYLSEESGSLKQNEVGKNSEEGWVDNTIYAD